MAQLCGFRESGITSLNQSRYMLSVRSSNRLEVPVASCLSSRVGFAKWKVFVAEEHFQFLIARANEKMQENFRRIATFEDAFTRRFCGKDM